MLDESSVCNVLAEGMYFLDKCIFWTKVAHQISTFWTFLCLSEVVQIPHLNFEARSQLLYKLCTILLYRSWNISVKCKWNFLETPIQSVQRSLNLLFHCTLFLMFSSFQKYLNPQVRTNKLVNSVVYHPCPSRLASGIHPFIFL